jgi:hypothetical protein
MADFALGSLTPRGTRRVVYCSDPSNTTRFLSEGRATPEELRGVVRNYAEAQAIDTVVQEVFSQGWSHFWRGESCEWDARPHHQRMVPMMDDGVMPIEVYVEECHRHGIELIAGFRMNDRHGHNADWFARLGQDKPHWILKGYDPSSKRTTDPRSYELGCALNYAEEEVRDFLFAVMEEVVGRFDVDGIEFNFTRLPACFPLGEAERSHAILTGFVRRIRAMLDAAGAERGRRLLLGVRVLQHLDGCLRMGYDIPVWIADRLIDYVVPGDIGFTDPNPRFEEFVRLARETDCYVYPQVQEWLGYDHRDLRQTPEHFCATVRNFYGAGADGFSTQNIFDVSRYPMLRVLREPERVAAHDRHYAFYPIWGSNAGRRAGYKGDFPYRAEEIVLPRDTPGAHGRIRFRLCEDLPGDSSAELLCRPAIVPGDEIEIDVNGQRVAPESIRCEWPDSEGQLPVCRFALGSPPAVYGDNHLGMRLTRSASGARDDVVLHEVEVRVQGAR